MPVEGRRERRVGSREDVAMEERRSELIGVREITGRGGGGRINVNLPSTDVTGRTKGFCFVGTIL